MRVHGSPVRLTARGPHAHVWPNAGAAANGEHVKSHTRLGHKLMERGVAIGAGDGRAAAQPGGVGGP